MKNQLKKVTNFSKKIWERPETRKVLFATALVSTTLAAIAMRGNGRIYDYLKENAPEHFNELFGMDE